MQNFADNFGSISAGDTAKRIQRSVRLNADLGAQVSQFVGHLSGHSAIGDGRPLFFSYSRIQRRVNAQLATGHKLQFVGGALGDHIRPL